jgi:hypothetical protein
MMCSEVDRRARRDCPRQCVADHGMHKDAPRNPNPKPTKTPTALSAELQKWLTAKQPWAGGERGA